MKTIETLKVGDQVPHGTYGNTLTVTIVERVGKAVRIVYTDLSGHTIENTYSGRTLRLKIKVL